MERIAPCQLKNKENPCHISCSGKSSRPGKGWPPPELWWLKRCEDVTPSLVNTIILNLQTTMGVFVPSYLEMPCWLIMDRDDIPTWADGPVAVMPNGILSFDEALAGEPDPMHSWDHLYFNTINLPYDYNREAACPKWIKFL